MSDLTPKITEQRKFDKWLEDTQFVVDPNPNDKPGIQVVTVEAVRKYFAGCVPVPAIVEVEKLRDVLSKLTNECRMVIALASEQVREEIGDANFECFKQRVIEASKHLALAAAAPQSGKGKKG